MEFATPTTKAELHSTLKEIFYYYRHQRVTVEIEDLKTLDLERLPYQEKTDQQLLENATTCLLDQHTREIENKKAELSDEIYKLNAQLSVELVKKEKLISLANENYNNSVKLANDNATKKGTYFSDLLLEKLDTLQKEKNTLIVQAEEQYLVEEGKILAQINLLQQKLDNVETEYQAFHEKEILAKADELKLKQEAIAREVFKYNNSLDEKEQRYQNSLLQIMANLKLKLLDIQQKELTKEQLVELGYYAAVITCVRSYYNTLEPITAYNELKRDSEAVLYLDHYYENILYEFYIAAIG